MSSTPLSISTIQSASSSEKDTFFQNLITEFVPFLNALSVNETYSPLFREAAQSIADTLRRANPRNLTDTFSIRGTKAEARGLLNPNSSTNKAREWLKILGQEIQGIHATNQMNQLSSALGVPLNIPLQRFASAEDITRTQQAFEDAWDVNIPEASRRNRAKLAEELGTLTDQEQQLYRTLTSMPFTLRHGTSFLDKIRESGELLSVQERSRHKLETRNSHTVAIGNLDDSVYCVFGAGSEHRVPLFLGDEADNITIPATAELMQKSGIFVAPHLSDYQSNHTLASEIYGGCRRIISHVWHLDHQTLEETREKTYTYIRPDQARIERKVTYADEVFYGEDIIPSLALKFIQELRDIGGRYQQWVLAQTGNQPRMEEIYNAHFHSWVYPEAQIPVRLSIEQEGVTFSRSELHPQAEALHNAAKEGNIRKVDRLLAEGVPIDAPFGKVPNALLACIRAHQSDMAMHLLRKGADASLADRNMFGSAKSLPMALNWCIPEVADSILDHGYIRHPDPALPIQHTISESLVEAMGRCLLNKNHTLLHRIVREFDLDIRYKDSGLISLAIANGENRWARFFVDKGCDVNGVHREIFSSLFTPLMQLAARKPQDRQRDDAQLAAYLIEKGADVNACVRKQIGFMGAEVGENFRTALYIAAEAENLPIVRVLVEHGADANLTNDLGETPLHAAERQGHSDVVEYLRGIGAERIPPQPVPLKDVRNAEYTCAAVVTWTNPQGERFAILGRTRETQQHLSNWCFPGGGVDRDPDARTAAIREVYEETGINLRQLLSAQVLKDAPCHAYEKIQVTDYVGYKPEANQKLRHHDTFVFDLGVQTNIQPKARDDFAAVRIVSLDKEFRVNSKEPISRRYTVDGVPVRASNGIFLDRLRQGKALTMEGVSDAMTTEYEGSRQLLAATAEGDTARVEELLNAGISIDVIDTHARGRVKGETRHIHGSPLTVAANLGDFKMVSFVLEKGGTLDIQNISASANSPVLAAVWSQHPQRMDILRHLLEQGANPDGVRDIVFAKNSSIDTTPLIEAVKLQDVEAAKLLLQHHANTDFRDGIYNKTPIHLAIENKHLPMIELLLSYHPALHYSWLEFFENETHHFSVLKLVEQSSDTVIAGKVAMEVVRQAVARVTETEPDTVYCSLHQDERGKTTIHIGLQDKVAAEKLAKATNATLRETEQGGYMLRFGSQRLSTLLEDSSIASMAYGMLDQYYHSGMMR